MTESELSESSHLTFFLKIFWILNINQSENQSTWKNIHVVYMPPPKKKTCIFMKSFYWNANKNDLELVSHVK